MAATIRSARRPATDELVSLVERSGSLGVVRLGFVLVVVALALLEPDRLRAPAAELVLASSAYLALLLTPWAIEQGSRARALRILSAGLLLDAVYLAWAVYSTGGTQSPLRALILVHVVVVTLLASWRTGLKITAWHSLLYVVAAYAQEAGLVAVREASRAALPGGAAFRTTSVLQIGALWAVALATAGCAGVNDRELRRQKIDLEQLSELVRELDRRDSAAEVPAALLEALCRVFGFSRGVVLASPEGELAVVATHGTEAGPSVTRIDAVIARSWDERRPQLVRALDPDADPRLASLLPGARNVLVVPLLLERGFRLGVVAVERQGRRSGMKRWVVAMVEQFASHAALTLHNAWLRDQLETQLDENRALQRRLVEQNLELEQKVQERTQELRESLHDLEVLDEQRRRLLARLVNAEEAQRQQIAGDIHDDPIQKLVAVSMRLQLLRRSLTDPEQLAELEKLLGPLRGAVKSLRHMIFELRPSVLDEEGLAPAIEEYLESLEADFASRVDARLTREPPPELRAVLYRMSQEALANVRKHAHAQHVEVTVGESNGGFMVRIVDDGVGFTPSGTLRSERGHLGLTSLRERAEMAGGSCRLLSLPGQGTTVELWVPGTPPSPPEADAGDDEDGEPDVGIVRAAPAVPIRAS